MKPPPLISTVGPVEPELLDAFISHYQALGIDRFLIALHFPEATDQGRKADLHDVCRNRIGKPAIVVEEPWHENASDPLRDELRDRAGSGWHLLVDPDEFHNYQIPLSTVIAAAEAAQERVVGGVMIDRVAADGTLAEWSPEVGLDDSYPLGGFLTAELLGGNARKIVLAHSDVRDVSTGNHRVPGMRPRNKPIVMIHHFKWRAGVLEYLRKRAEMFASGVWQEVAPASRQEAMRLLAHVAENGGKINVFDPGLPFRRVDLRTAPSWWHDEAQQLRDHWPPRVVRAAR